MAGNIDDWPVVIKPHALDAAVGETIPVTADDRMIGSGVLRADGSFEVTVAPNAIREGDVIQLHCLGEVGQ